MDPKDDNRDASVRSLIERTRFLIERTEATIVRTHRTVKRSQQLMSISRRTSDGVEDEATEPSDRDLPRKSP